MALTSLAGRSLGMLLPGLWLILNGRFAVAQYQSFIHSHNRLGGAGDHRRYPDSDPPLAIELNPNVADIHYRYGLIYLIPVGRTDEAIREIKRALELEPLSIAMNANLAGAYMYARQNDRALEQARKTYDLEPNHITARVWLANVYESLGMYNEAIALSELSLKNHPSDQYFLLYSGYAYAKTGRRDKTEDAIKKLHDLEKTEPVDAYDFAMLYVGLGDKDKAFVELEKSFNERGYYVPLLRVDPLMDPLRDDPRFADLIKRIGLPQ